MSKVVDSITADDGAAIGITADVTRFEDMTRLVATSVERFGRIDVMPKNAGVMPFAFFADHAAALSAWQLCIDINFKGILNGMVPVHDQMIAQGRGHVINVSTIYGNFPVVGAGVYGATKAAVNVLSKSLRMESRGKIKVTTIKPTGVLGTALAGGVVNRAAVAGILGNNLQDYLQARTEWTEGRLDPQSPDYVFLDADHIADAMMHASDQPWGVSIGKITVRAMGDHVLL